VARGAGPGRGAGRPVRPRAHPAADPSRRLNGPAAELPGHRRGRSRRGSAGVGGRSPSSGHFFRTRSSALLPRPKEVTHEVSPAMAVAITHRPAG
jgi:hypothetical protein